MDTVPITLNLISQIQIKPSIIFQPGLVKTRRAVNNSNLPARSIYVVTWTALKLGEQAKANQFPLFGKEKVLML